MQTSWDRLVDIILSAFLFESSSLTLARDHPTHLSILLLWFRALRCRLKISFGNFNPTIAVCLGLSHRTTLQLLSTAFPSNPFIVKNSPLFDTKNLQSSLFVTLLFLILTPFLVGMRLASFFANPILSFHTLLHSPSLQKIPIALPSG